MRFVETRTVVDPLATMRLQGYRMLLEAKDDRMSRAALARLTKGPVIYHFGHWIGGGRKSILTVHRNLMKAVARNVRRRAEGRYVWDFQHAAPAKV